MINKSADCLIIGFDKSDEDEAVLVVSRRGPRAGGVTIINTFTGEAAIDIYNILISKTTQNKEGSDNVTEEL